MAKTAIVICIRPPRWTLGCRQCGRELCHRSSCIVAKSPSDGFVARSNVIPPTAYPAASAIEAIRSFLRHENLIAVHNSRPSFCRRARNGHLIKTFHCACQGERGLSIGGDNDRREKSRDHRAACRCHFAGNGAKRPGTGGLPPVAGGAGGNPAAAGPPGPGIIPHDAAASNSNPRSAAPTTRASSRTRMAHQPATHKKMYMSAKGHKPLKDNSRLQTMPKQ